MPNSRQRSVMASPSSNRATKRRRSSTTEDSFQGIGTSRLLSDQAKSVTHVSGTIRHLCLGSLSHQCLPMSASIHINSWSISLFVRSASVLVLQRRLAATVGTWADGWRQAIHDENASQALTHQGCEHQNARLCGGWRQPLPTRGRRNKDRKQPAGHQ